MRQVLHEIEVVTQGRGMVDITHEVGGLVRSSKFSTGLATMLIRHTSASLLIQENADPEVQCDLDRIFARFAPDGDPIFHHTSEGDDDMPAHVRTALTTVHISIPIRNGRLDLGTWQGIYLWEHRTAPHRRSVSIHLLGE